MFTRVFELIQSYGLKVQWEHLDGRGFRALIMDMDTKQLPGIYYIPNIFLISFSYIRIWPLPPVYRPSTSKVAMAYPADCNLLRNPFQARN